VRVGWRVVLLLALGVAVGPARAQQPPEDPARVVGPPRGARLQGAALEARADEVAGLLRCPVCQGLSVADSPSTMASNMRAQVKDLVAAGYDEEQVLSYFERSYGEFVRLKPPLRGVNWLVWLAPLLGLLLGAVVIAWALRAPRAAPAGGATDDAATPALEAMPGPDTLPADPSLARCILRIRERAYGWPGGVSPAHEGGPAAAPVPAAGRPA
jgi:cytochrome c-type biogenesis protein CcmH